jgi:hypothetical protein
MVQLNEPMQVPPRMGENQSVASMAALVDQATGGDAVPTIEALESTTVDLPAGWISPQGVLHSTAIVRELTGYDEERLAKIDSNKSTAQWETELLLLGVASIGSEVNPSRDVFRSLLVGDRDTLMLGIRRVTYGNTVEFILTCANCDEKSEVGVEIDNDVVIKPMEEPEKRQYEVPLKRGVAITGLLTGVVQESLSDVVNKKTPAEMNTLLLSKCVESINGIPVLGDSGPIQRLSAGDRATLVDFIVEHQPGPQLGGIEVPCASCGQVYPISLGLGNLFRG